MKTIRGLLAVLLAAAPVRAGDLAKLSKTLEADAGSGGAWNAFYDGGRASAAPAAPVAGGPGGSAAPLEAPLTAAPLDATVPPSPSRDHLAPLNESGAWEGLKNGASEGALGGFFAVISPAAALMSEGFGRKMSRAYDGARSDNGGGQAYEVGGVALGLVLYAPALAVGAVCGVFGAIAGAVSEAVKPGSTKTWDAEKVLFG